jgi:hypothetical protein
MQLFVLLGTTAQKVALKQFLVPSELIKQQQEEMLWATALSATQDTLVLVLQKQL